MGANERQVGGSHYKVEDGKEEHWDRVARLDLDYFQGQITKYVERWRDKGGIQDLKKASHFLEKYIEVETGKAMVAAATPIAAAAENWRLEQKKTGELLATHGGASSSSEEVSRRKVRSSRKK